jgi:molybdenum cofactor cytidylyltransferase
MPDVRVAGLLLAAGQGTRFGGGKLDADCAGQPLGLHAAKALAAAATGGIFAVTSAKQTPFSDALAGLGYALIINDAPERGLAHSIATGAVPIAESEADAMLITLADMPHVTTAHLAALIAEYARDPRIIGTSHGSIRTPPAIFPRASFVELLALTGDAGARHLLSTADHLAVPSDALEDVDTQQELRTAINRLR